MGTQQQTTEEEKKEQARRSPVVTDAIRRAVEGGGTSTPRSATQSTTQNSTQSSRGASFSFTETPDDDSEIIALAQQARRSPVVTDAIRRAVEGESVPMHRLGLHIKGGSGNPLSNIPVVTPQLRQQAEAQLGITPSTSARSMLDALSQTSRSTDAGQIQEQDEVEAAIQTYKQALEKRDSAYQAIVESMNPDSQGEYSEETVNREKRKSIAVSLGNLLSALAAGAMAYRGIGLGHTPTITPNKALAKLSDIESDYIKAGKDYNDALIKLRFDKAKSEALRAGEELEYARSSQKAAWEAANALELQKIKNEHELEKIATAAQNKKDSMQLNATIQQAARDDAHKKQIELQKIKKATTSPSRSDATKDSQSSNAQDSSDKVIGVVTTSKTKEEKKKDGLAAAGADIES